jgi:hypothetical protein
MSTNFQKVVALLHNYKSKERPTRGRPKLIHDIDRTKVDEVIHDTKLDDDLRSSADSRETGPKNWRY